MSQELKKELHLALQEKDSLSQELQVVRSQLPQEDLRQEVDRLGASLQQAQRDLANSLEEKTELQNHMRELTQSLSASHTIPLEEYEKVASEARNAKKLYEELHQDHEDLRRQKTELEQSNVSLGGKEEKARQDLERLRSHLMVQNEEATAEALRSNEAMVALQGQLKETQEQLDRLKERGPEMVQVEDEGLQNRVSILETDLEELRRVNDQGRTESQRHQAAASNLEVALEMLQTGSLDPLVDILASSETHSSMSFCSLFSFFQPERDVQINRIKTDSQRQLSSVLAQLETSQANAKELEVHR